MLYGKSPHSQKQRLCRTCTIDKLVLLLLCWLDFQIYHMGRAKIVTLGIVYTVIYGQVRKVISHQLKQQEVFHNLQTASHLQTTLQVLAPGWNSFIWSCLQDRGSRKRSRRAGRQAQGMMRVLWGAPSWHEEHTHVSVFLTGEFYNVWKTVIQCHRTPGGLSALFLLPQLMWCVPTPSPALTSITPPQPAHCWATPHQLVQQQLLILMW